MAVQGRRLARFTALEVEIEILRLNWDGKRVADQPEGGALIAGDLRVDMAIVRRKAMEPCDPYLRLFDGGIG